MAERFKARDGVRVPLPSGGDWPAEGRAVNFANPFEARLVAAVAVLCPRHHLLLCDGRHHRSVRPAAK